MPIYRLKVAGAKPVVVKADSAAKAKDRVIEVDALSAEDLHDHVSDGGTIYKDGDVLIFEAAVKSNDDDGDDKTSAGPAVKPSEKGTISKEN